MVQKMVRRPISHVGEITAELPGMPALFQDDRNASSATYRQRPACRASPARGTWRQIAAVCGRGQAASATSTVPGAKSSNSACPLLAQPRAIREDGQIRGLPGRDDAAATRAHGRREVDVRHPPELTVTDSPRLK